MPGGSSTLLMPTGYAVTLTGVSAQVIPPNPTRKGLWFHNPSLTVNAFISPQPIVAIINGAGSIELFPGGWLMFDALAASCGWNGIGGGPLTILEWAAS